MGEVVNSGSSRLLLDALAPFILDRRLEYLMIYNFFGLGNNKVFRFKKK